MFLNNVLAHRFLGIWALLLSFFLVAGGRQEKDPAAEEPGPGPRSSWGSGWLEAAAAWAWVAVLARGLPTWRVTMAWGGEGLVLFDSRAPLWAALGVWALFRHRREDLADLVPYILVAAWIADPGAFAPPWWAGGFQTFTAGEGIPNLLVLLLPTARWLTPAPPTNGHQDAHLLCLLVGSCFWGFLPTLAIATVAGATSPPSSGSWRTAGTYALLVAASLEWLEGGTLLPGSLAGALAATLLFTLGRILPIVGKMVS